LHEATERYLKGFLIAKGWALKRTHDLKVMVKDAATFLSEFGRFLDLAERLTAEFLEQHYPGGGLTHVGENYPEMRPEVAEIVALIQRAVPEFFPDSQTGGGEKNRGCCGTDIRCKPCESADHTASFAPCSPDWSSKPASCSRSNAREKARVSRCAHLRPGRVRRSATVSR